MYMLFDLAEKIKMINYLDNSLKSCNFVSFSNNLLVQKYIAHTVNIILN